MKIRGILAVGALAALAGTASADVVLTWGFTELNGTYNSITTEFTAKAENNGNLQTTGDVSRLVAPLGTALFQDGFVSGADQANYDMKISVFGKVGNTAQGAGSVTITDANGDTIYADITGDWISPGFGIVYFNGLLANVKVTDNSGDGMFDGPGGGSFSSDFSAYSNLNGALVQLFTRTGVGFFNTSFSNVTTLVSANVVPTPGSLALVGVAGVLAARRRSR